MKSAIEDITLHTSKPLSRPVKASFNPLFVDRSLSTTVPLRYDVPMRRTHVAAYPSSPEEDPPRKRILEEDCVPDYKHIF